MIKTFFCMTTALLSVVLVSCAPKVDSVSHENPQLAFKTELSDIDLKIKFPEPEAKFDFSTHTNWAGNIALAEVYRQIENLYSLGLSELGKNLMDKTREIEIHSNPISLELTPLTDLAISRTSDTVKSTLADVTTNIDLGSKTILSVLDKVTQENKFPNTSTDVVEAGRLAANFLKELKKQLALTSVYGPMKKEVDAELDFQIQHVQELANEISDKTSQSQTLANLIGSLETVLNREKFDVDQDIATSLEQARILGSDLLNCNSSQGALTVVVGVWTMLDAAERESYVKPMNADLYNYLLKQNEKDLKCLRSDHCSGLIHNIIKHLIILPKIANYGVAKICTEVNLQALVFTKKYLRDSSPLILNKIPSLINDKLLLAVNDNKTKMSAATSDYPKFVKERVASWKDQILKGDIIGFEPNHVNVNLSQNSLAILDSHSSIQVTAKSLGQAFSMYKKSWDSQGLNAGQMLKSEIEQVNRLAALPAFLSPLDPAAPLLDLEKAGVMMANQSAYAMPDQVLANPAMLPLDRRPDINTNSYSVKSQAQMIRGVSAMIGFFQDWNITAYENSLGSVKVQDLVPDFKAAELEQSMFPKSDLLALAVAEGATLLKNATKNQSQFFAVDLENKIHWLSDVEFFSESPAVMAGVTDLVNGQRSLTVRAEDVSEMIIALSDFIKNTKGIENTRSQLLLQKDAKTGESPLDQVLAAKNQLRSLVIGLANLLSHQFISKNHSVVDSMSLADLNAQEKNNLSVRSQVLAIKALLAAASSTGVNVYQLSAMDLYYSMNQRFYNPRLHLYSVDSSETARVLPDVLETLEALTELRPSLPTPSQQQLDWIVTPWIDGLKNIK